MSHVRRQLLRIARSRRLTPLRRFVLDRRPPLDRGRLERWRSEPSEPGVAALVGDSLAADFPPEPGLLIRGWPSETIAELRARVGEALERRPGVLILLTGANDVLRGRDPRVIAEQYDALLAECRAALPGARIAALGLPPLSPSRAPVATVRGVNATIRQQAAAHDVLFVDLFDALATDRGDPLPGMSRDGVHLSGRAYSAIASLLRRMDVLPTPELR
jgi:lysophospholipase L1-like esterase